MIRAGILGAGGFTGQELLKILARHPECKPEIITSNEYAGKTLLEVLPFISYGKNSGLTFIPHPEDASALKGLDVVFLATPDNVALEWVPRLTAAGIAVVDISGAYRLQDAGEFRRFYDLDHNDPGGLAQAVYGLTEANRQSISGSKLVSNPGCYPTGSLLPLWAMREALKDFEDLIIIDAKSGTSGAGGRKEKDGMGFSGVYENFRAYKVPHHQHAPEIRQEVNRFVPGHRKRIRFTPHLLPMFRGILSTVYLTPRNGEQSVVRAREALRNSADAEAFLRYFSSPNQIETRNTHSSNFCDFSIAYDEDSGVAVLISAIDNLVKGAAGQAVQNMNVMFRSGETLGLIP